VWSSQSGLGVLCRTTKRACVVTSDRNGRVREGVSSLGSPPTLSSIISDFAGPIVRSRTPRRLIGRAPLTRSKSATGAVRGAAMNTTKPDPVVSAHRAALAAACQRLRVQHHEAAVRDDGCYNAAQLPGRHRDAAGGVRGRALVESPADYPIWHSDPSCRRGARKCIAMRERASTHGS
jgi:hypothetical protein